MRGEFQAVHLSKAASRAAYSAGMRHADSYDVFNYGIAPDPDCLVAIVYDRDGRYVALTARDVQMHFTAAGQYAGKEALCE